MKDFEQEDAYMWCRSHGVEYDASPLGLQTLALVCLLRQEQRARTQEAVCAACQNPISGENGFTE